MKKYYLAIPRFDCEVLVTLTEGSESSLEYIKEDIEEHLTAFPEIEKGYTEQYPFYMADWEIVGWKLPDNFLAYQEITA
jgi:hypothetical protein